MNLTGQFIGFLVEEKWDRRPIEFHMRGIIVPLNKKFLFEVSRAGEARLRIIKDETKTGSEAEEQYSRHCPGISSDANIQSTLFLLTSIYIDAQARKQ
jgi:hypothetical protein